MLCRHVYNAAIEERREAWQKCGVSVGYYQQKAELPLIKAEMPEFSEVRSQVLPGCRAAGRPRIPRLLSSRQGR
jgi:putative transposase